MNLDPAQLLASLPNGSVSVFDRDLRYAYADGRGLHEVGLTPTSLIGKRLVEAFPADAISLVEPQYRKAFEGHLVVFGLHYFHRTYALSAAPFHTENGTVTQIIVVAQDVSALADGASSGEPSLANLETDQFVAMLGHELRNPLGAVRAAAGVIKHSPDRLARERARDVIDRQVVVAENLLNDLTELSRAKRGVLQLHFTDTRLAQVVNEAVETVAHLASAAGQSIVTEPCFAADLTLRVDRPRLLQVVTNLLTNAIRYSSAEATITIACGLTSDSVSIAITDEGRGIAPKALDRIFDLFQQGPASRKEGLGIGLWVAREIVRLHGGRIDVFSAGEGEGATFTVRLPLALTVDG
jgi:signal transduction histidine kinase